MQHVFTGVKLSFAAIGGFLTYLLGGWDIWLSALIFFMVSDFLTGLIKAGIGKSDKSETGHISSAAIFQGGFRKILILVIVAAGVTADRLISPDSTTLRALVIGYYVASEAISVCENVIACGLPLPKKFVQIFEAMKSKNDEQV